MKGTVLCSSYKYICICMHIFMKRSFPKHNFSYGTYPVLEKSSSFFKSFWRMLIPTNGGAYYLIQCGYCVPTVATVATVYLVLTAYCPLNYLAKQVCGTHTSCMLHCTSRGHVKPSMHYAEVIFPSMQS